MRAHNPFPNQDRWTKALALFQSLAFPHRLGQANEPRARTQPAKQKQSQCLIACDTCKNKPAHEATPFRPLSTNSQKSCCSRTTYQNEVKKTQGTNACNNRGIVFWTSRIIRKTQNQHSWMKRPCKKYMAIRLKTTHMYMESSKGSGWKVHNGLKHGRVRSWAQFLFPK